MDLKTILRLIKLRMRKSKRVVELDPNDLINSFGGIYQHGFDAAVPLDVSFLDQPAIDVGGVGRHFLSDLVIKLATSTNLSLFKGDLATGVLPFVNQEAVIAGYYKMFRQVLVHRILQERPAFPYLPKCVFTYLSSLPSMSANDLPLASKSILEQVSCSTCRLSYLYLLCVVSAVLVCVPR